ncbi:MAG: hypothetical protein K4304_03890 [Propionicimonas sp.]
MSSLLHPTGSESPQIYWRRRILVLAGVLLLVVGVIVAWPKGAPPTAPTAVDSASVAVSPATTGTPSATPTPTPSGPLPCDTANLRLTMAGYKKLAQGARQPFAVTVKNVGAVPCVLDLNATNFSLTVTSGSDRIWSTADCAKWVPAKKLTVKSQASYQFTITWALVRSTPTCKTGTSSVNPGTYVGSAVFSDTLRSRVVTLITKKA